MFFKQPRKIQMKQPDIIGSFAEVLTNNQAKNRNKISDEKRNKLDRPSMTVSSV